MYIYATLGGGVRRFSTIGWIKWLEYIKAGGDKEDVGMFSKCIGSSCGEMQDWDAERAQLELESMEEKRKQRKRRVHGR